MATHPATPYQTTLAAALTASGIIVKTAASTGFVAGSYIVIGNEVMLLTVVDTTNHTHEVKRGVKGTKAVAHENASVVTLGTASYFGANTTNGVEIAGYDGDFGTPKLPIGTKWVDPMNGYEYLLCDTAAALVAGEWVVITADGAASQLAATSKGRVGICTEAVSASDKLAWILVKGSYASAMTDSDVTTATGLQSATGYAAVPSSAAGAYIRRASATSAPSTATSPTYGGGLATVYIDHPWTDPYDAFVS